MGAPLQGLAPALRGRLVSPQTLLELHFPAVRAGHSLVALVPPLLQLLDAHPHRMHAGLVPHQLWVPLTGVVAIWLVTVVFAGSPYRFTLPTVFPDSMLLGWIHGGLAARF